MRPRRRRRGCSGDRQPGRVGPQHEHLVRRVAQQPGDVVDAEPVAPPVARRGDHDALRGHVLEQLAQRVAVRAAAARSASRPGSRRSPRAARSPRTPATPTLAGARERRARAGVAAGRVARNAGTTVAFSARASRSAACSARSESSAPMNGNRIFALAAAVRRPPGGGGQHERARDAADDQRDRAGRSRRAGSWRPPSPLRAVSDDAHVDAAGAARMSRSVSGSRSRAARCVARTSPIST